jgi:acyl-CoA synthetase (AMP-forming)/AMP-acid ligase II
MGPSRPPAPERADQQRVGLMTTPMFHNGAIVTGLSNFIDGHRIVLLQGKFNPEEVLRVIRDERVTAWQAVPTMFNRVLNHPDVARYDLSSLAVCSTGGTLVPGELLETLRARIPRAADGFVIGYGMTENSFVSMASGAQVTAHPGTVGKAVPGVELRIGDPDPSGEGEVLARSAGRMIGYLDAEEDPIDSEGWYRTGDLGRIDEEGLLYITGRCKDMVIRGGENIACAHVENAIASHPDVLEVAVTGYPDRDLGEAVAAIVHGRPGLTEAELRAFVQERLAYFEIPSLWEFRNEPLPVLAAGKIDKRALARELATRVVNHA